MDAMRSRLHLMLVPILLVQFLGGCHTVARFEAVRFKSESLSLDGPETTVAHLDVEGVQAVQVESEGTVVTTQAARVYIPLLVNPGVHVTLLVRNGEEQALLLDPGELSFSRFPPHQRPKDDGVAVAEVTVEPAERLGECWRIIPGDTAKVHVYFPKPARAPGYMRFVLRRDLSGEELVYAFKVI